jgi:hypothetical protein
MSDTLRLPHQLTLFDDELNSCTDWAMNVDGACMLEG